MPSPQLPVQDTLFQAPAVQGEAILSLQVHHLHLSSSIAPHLTSQASGVAVTTGFKSRSPSALGKGDVIGGLKLQPSPEAIWIR